MALHGGKRSFIEGFGQYSQSLFDNMWLDHMLRVEKTGLLSGTLPFYCPFILKIVPREAYKQVVWQTSPYLPGQNKSPGRSS